MDYTLEGDSCSLCCGSRKLWTVYETRETQGMRRVMHEHIMHCVLVIMLVGTSLSLNHVQLQATVTTTLMNRL